MFLKDEELRHRVEINGDMAIKPYYYLRNGLLHVRYTVDRCVKLSREEEFKLKKEIGERPWDKQFALSQMWNLLTVMVGKEIVIDGIKAGDERIQELSKGYENGHKN